MKSVYQIVADLSAIICPATVKKAALPYAEATAQEAREWLKANPVPPNGSVTVEVRFFRTDSQEDPRRGYFWNTIGNRSADQVGRFPTVEAAIADAAAFYSSRFIVERPELRFVFVGTE